MKQTIKLNRLLAGIFSLALILLVIVGPLYLAEKLEVIETASNELVETSSIMSESNTTTSFQSYMEYNETTATEHNLLNSNAHINAQWNSASWEYGGYTATYNVDGYQDTVTIPQDDVYRIFVNMEVSAVDLQNDNCLDMFINYSCSDAVKLANIRFLTLDGTNSQISYYEIFANANYYTERLEEFTITTTQINEMVSLETTDSPTKSILRYNFAWDYASSQVDSPTLNMDIRINSEYSEVTTTTWNNQTVTTYTPYIQKVTPYQVHKVMMGVGAVLIGLIGWIASPWGEVLDGALPINSQSPRISAISGRRKNRRRK